MKTKILSIIVAMATNKKHAFSHLSLFQKYRMFKAIYLKLATTLEK
jgi:hypothetical protein